jgi:hypothetical protein
MILITIVGFLILTSNVSVVVAENGGANTYISSESEVLLKKYFHGDSLHLYNDIFKNTREYWAVLIGLGDYPGNHDLPYSINEILSFKNTLLHGGNWNETHIQVLTNSQANKSAIFDAIDWLGSNADKDDLSLFYFAGHGSRTSHNEYLQAYDESISDDELNEKLDVMEGQVVVILDSCFSGGFIEEVGKRGRVVLTACKKDEETYQVHNLSSGIFGYFLNASLEYLTKNAEITFLFTWLFSVYYSNKLSQEFNGDYTIHPQMYDGNLKMTRIINRHHYMQKLLYELFTIPVEHDDVNIWKM